MKRSSIAVGLVLCALPAGAQRFAYPLEEFSSRRATLCRETGPGLVLMFGRTTPVTAARFRQDNDFYYLTGSEDASAALVIDAAKCEAFLFVPAQNESQLRVDGGNALQDPESAKKGGFAAVHPLDDLGEFLARRRTGGPQKLWVRLSERDEVDMSRGDKALYVARRSVSLWGAQPTEDAYRVSALRERFPYYELADVSPLLDRQRLIKSPREIEALRRNGRVSAEAIRAAMEVTRPGRYEYELEAEASYVHVKGGAEGPGYAAIVGSGSTVNTWHYTRNARRLEAGDVVVMDYGASFGYQTVDITRTWPVAGRFDALQLRAYRAVLEAQQAIIAALRPGATRGQTTELCKRVFEKHGFGEQRAFGAGHYVGMAVHDVGDYRRDGEDVPFARGMVIAVEPIIEVKEKQLHVRIEDTVLVTDGAPEVLSAGVPKEVDEVLALVGTR
jgi:Xaa-Pro aminopeptidase